MYIKTLTVSELNKYVKNILNNDFILNNSKIEGEISNLKIHSSGHIYFSLKDSFSKINCIMFRSNAAKLKFIPENGMNVVINGYVSVYEKEGIYQLYCVDMNPKGLGDLYMAFEKLKEKLGRKGLFDEEHKKSIPKFPKKIGVITSPTGAAIRDIINVTTRRNKSIDILICKALVQGTDASKTIIEGIEKLNKIEDIDIIIIARGGGSIEELWSFNDENLAYAIYNSKKPIITGVGHETDFTIADFVSDKRAPTPSAAAEIAVFNKEEWENQIINYKYHLENSMDNLFKQGKNQLAFLKHRLESNTPFNIIVNEYNNIDKLKELLNIKITSKVNWEKERLYRLRELLKAHNPLNILDKGYAIVKDDNDIVIGSKNNLKNKDFIHITFKDGSTKLKIEEVK
ncbi:exodeoxyribonuclease VII large subunit [Clostridium niameyense]|uniref:exodeoxyribonuclease VII large subunit n=1 Tax=Clostridium niameyense TaxID=1622073 RepID=UPI00067F4E8E|nr:exodeoxyribonuclease VII large subunit [Clostridium niameyense]